MKTRMMHINWNHTASELYYYSFCCEVGDVTSRSSLHVVLQSQLWWKETTILLYKHSKGCQNLATINLFKIIVEWKRFSAHAVYLLCPAKLMFIVFFPVCGVSGVTWSHFYFWKREESKKGLIVCHLFLTRKFLARIFRCLINLLQRSF